MTEYIPRYILLIRGILCKLRGCSPLDMLIGAHAKSLNMTLVTNNVREFERIKDLKI